MISLAAGVLLKSVPILEKIAPVVTLEQSESRLNFVSGNSNVIPSTRVCTQSRRDIKEWSPRTV